jgi:hypothetical protein
MTVNIRWLDPSHSILLHDYIGGYTIADYFDALASTQKMLASVEYRVDIVSDLSKGTLQDTGILKAINDTENYLHPQHYLFVLIGADAFIERTIDLAKQILPGMERRVRLATSLPEALVIIQQSRAKAEPAPSLTHIP